MKLVRYFFVGGTAAVVDFVIFAALIKWTGVPWFWSAVFSFTVATLVNYVLSIRFVFRKGARFEHMHHEVFMVFVVSLVGLGINQSVLWICISRAGIDPLISKVIGTGVVFFWNYGVRRYFVFSPAGAKSGRHGLEVDRRITKCNVACRDPEVTKVSGLPSDSEEPR